ncbi:MAG: hypothetical protein ACKOEM_08505 [Planctomycetia bacterium]
MHHPDAVGDGGHDHLTRAIGECNRRLDQIESANRLTRWLLTGGSLALLAMAGLFVWSLWKTLERQVTAEGLEKALQAKVEAIGPPLGEKLASQVMGAVPAYGDLAMERGMKLLPEMSSRIATEADSFATDTEKMVRARSEEAMQRVARKLAADLKRDFPKLTETRVEQLAGRLRDGLISEGAGLGEQVERTIATERERLAALLDKLPIADAMTEAESRLQKRFIHNVLMMVDSAVEQWPVDDAPAATPPAAVRSTPAPAEAPDPAPAP